MGFNSAVFIVLVVVLVTDCITKENSRGMGLEREKRNAASLITFQNLKIAAFNVRTFGLKKLTYVDVPAILVKVILRYHIILIQEIRDSSLTAMLNLLSMINRDSSNTYNMTISPRLGRTSSKEQYAFVYRTDLVSVRRTYVYDDGDEATGVDTFEREPYIVHFNSPYTVIQDFSMVAIHTSPSKAASEIDALVDVYDDVRARWSMDDVIILGDLNAACLYMKDSDWQVNRLATDKRFRWLISNCIDTTVAGALCAYDRFVSAGTAMTSAYVPGSAARFKFDTEYGISHSLALKVSDHYPIEMEIYCTGLTNDMQSVRDVTEYKFLARNPPQLTSRAIYRLRYRSNPLLSQGFVIDTLYTRSAIRSIVNTKIVTTARDALQAIKQIYDNWSSLLTKAQADIASYKATQNFGKTSFGSASVKLVCKKLPAPVECWVALEVQP